MRPPGYVRPLDPRSELFLSAAQVRAMVACPPAHLDGCGAPAGRACGGLGRGSVNHLARVAAARALLRSRRLP